MCKACKMNPRDVRIFRQRQGAVEIDDFEPDFRHVKSAKPKPRKRQRGCPGNDNGAHVYVWVPRNSVYFWDNDDWFIEFFGYPKREVKVCAGCGKTGKYRETERYLAEGEKWFKKNYKDVTSEHRGESVGRMPYFPGRVRMWNWESLIPEYTDFLKSKKVY